MGMGPEGNKIVVPTITYSMRKFLLGLTPEKLEELQQFLKGEEKKQEGKNGNDKKRQRKSKNRS